MTTVYHRLKTTTPAAVEPPGGTFAGGARTARAWVERLPMANFASAAQQLLEALQAANRQRMDGVQRLDTLEILRTPAVQVAAAADKQIIGASFPLPPSKSGLGELASGIHRELAVGYRAALADLCAPQGAVPFLRGKQVLLAGLRAQQHATDHLAAACLLYRAPPTGAWRAMHAVHAFMAQLRLDDRAADAAGDSARAAYLQALLFALANPYGHTQREQGETAALVRVLAPYCELRDGNGGEGDLFIDADADRGPGYLPEERVDATRGTLALHLGRMRAFVDEQLAAVPADAATVAFRTRGGSAMHVDAGLARGLAAAWGAHTGRGHARLGGGHLLETAIGLHELHFALAGNEDFDTFMRRTSGHSISLSETDRTAAWRSGGAVHASRARARVIDQALGGYRLLWERNPGGENVRARVGELIGLARPAPDGIVEQDWMIGVIRWLRIDEHDRVDAGVELLARRALPISVRACGEAARSPLRGLLLASLPEPGIDYDGLLTPTEIDRHANEIELSMPPDLHGTPASARPGCMQGVRVHQATGIYQHFTFVPHAA